jgi:hypothetical protein
MRQYVVVILVAISATAFALPQSVARGSHPKWAVGEWAWIDAGERPNGDPCQSFEKVRYHPNGRYDFMDESGRWYVTKERLVEVMLSAGGTGDPAGLGEKSEYVIAKIATDHVVFTKPAGQLRLCSRQTR